MLQINILILFIGMTHSAPAPYYSLVESPTSRFEQHFFTSMNQPPVKMELQRQILPISVKQEFPNQHVAYFYPEMQIQNTQHSLNHHQLRHESWHESQNQFLGQKAQSEEQSDEDKSEETLQISSTHTPENVENIEIGLESTSTIKPMEKLRINDRDQFENAEKPQIAPELKQKIEEILPKEDEKTLKIEETTSKEDVESIEIRADLKERDEILRDEAEILNNPQNHLQNPNFENPQNPGYNHPQNPPFNQAFNPPQIPQPLLHKLFTIDNQFYVASAPEFYGFFHPIHNPTAPIFSLQELQPIVRADNNIEAKTAKIHNIAALPMSTSVSRTNREGEAAQLAPSALRINVVDEDEIKEIKSNEATETKARSKLPSHNQSSEMEKEIEASREEDKREQSVEGRDISDESSVAQAKPSGTAIAGDGGVASSKPVATAVSGQKGLAVASPSATAVAGNFAFGDEDRKKEVKTRKPGNTAQEYRKMFDFNEYLF